MVLDNNRAPNQTVSSGLRSRRHPRAGPGGFQGAVARAITVGPGDYSSLRGCADPSTFQAWSSLKQIP